jgi:urease accessory protein
LTVTALPLLLLSDGRFPGGGHAHSGGLEGAVADCSVDPADPFPSFEAFVLGRLATTGAIDAWLAAAACLGGDEVALDAEADARCPSPALRLASRRLGRGLRRAAGRSFPALVGGPGQHHPVVVGVVARAAGLSASDAARLAVHHLVVGAASAAVRLLPIDAADAMAVAMRLTPCAEEVAASGCLFANGPLADGPAWSAPLVEVRAEQHARWEVRLFAS